MNTLLLEELLSTICVEKNWNKYSISMETYRENSENCPRASTDSMWRRSVQTPSGRRHPGKLLLPLLYQTTNIVAVRGFEEGT